MNLEFVRPLPTYYGHRSCCEPDPACLPVSIPKWPTVDEYNAVFKIAIGNLAYLSHQLGKNYLMGIVKNNSLLARAKKAWLWFYALYSFNPLLFEGNVLSAEAFWKIAECSNQLKKTCGSAASWQSWG